MRTFCLLIIGSQVRALVRPPPSLQVSNSAGEMRICPVNSGPFRVRPCLRVSLCKTKMRIWTLRLCIEKFRSRLGVRDRFDDWVVGLQFVPDYLHHPVSANRAFPSRRQIGRFCGDFRHSIPWFRSLRALARLNDDFWRFVSASKNSVPGGCVEREVWTALHPEFRLLSHRNSEPSAGAAAIPD